MEQLKPDSANSTIHSKGMLVVMSISSWTARKLDRKVTRETNKQYNADSDAGRFNKLLVGQTAMDKITKAISAVRSYHYDNTLPWGDDGSRVLSSVHYFEYMGEIGILKDDFDKAVDDFIKDYPEYVEEAETRLQKMFDPKDYPSQELLREKFEVKLDVQPIPHASDFRVDLANDEVEKIQRQIEEQVARKVEHANVTILYKIREKVGKVIEKLSDNDSVFRDSLIENIKTLVSVIPKLNFIEDKDVDSLAYDMKKLFVSPDALRNNSYVRSNTLKNAQEIFNKVTLYLNERDPK